MPAPVRIYTTTYCPHCSRAKALLERKKISFREIDVTNDEAAREKIEKQTGWMTVPMIFVGEKFIGGADALFSLDASGELEKMIKSS